MSSAHLPTAAPAPPAPSPRAYASLTPPSSPSVSGERAIRGALDRDVRSTADPTSSRASPDAQRMPLPYVIASAFFLAIAVVGFGVWLAFAVISL